MNWLCLCRAQFEIYMKEKKTQCCSAFMGSARFWCMCHEMWHILPGLTSFSYTRGISALKKRRESCLQLLDDGREGEIMPEGYLPFDYNLWRIMGHDID